VRAMTVAGAGQIIVTASVAAAVTGQTPTLETLGPHKLKGLPGTWDLFRVANIAHGRT
jgi:class 3 adenylate cyclase